MILLSAMAHAVNIDVKPVLISTWHNGRPDTTLPSALQFNHLIGFAPDVAPGGVWLDATDKAGTFGTLPWYDQGVPVVVAGLAEKGYRTITPEDPPSANNSLLNWNAELNADGSALISGRSILTGPSRLNCETTCASPTLRTSSSGSELHWHIDVRVQPSSATLSRRCARRKTP